MTPTTVCPLHWYYRDDHLAHVTEQMLRLGPPTLRGYLDADTGTVLLREGTHRIRAAHRLGLVPTIRAIPWWRSRASLERARYAAARRGLVFSRVKID